MHGTEEPVAELTPFLAELVLGIEEELGETGDAVYITAARRGDEERALWDAWIADGSVDAVIMTDASADDDRLDALASLPIPAVLLGGPEDRREVWHVVVDNAGGARAAARTLLDLGHRRLARLSGPRQLLHTITRDEAFVETCREGGAEVALREGDFSEESGRLAVRALLGSATPPTAVFCDSDLMALGALRACAERGLRVPADISILTWDDTANARLATPRLGAVTIDLHELGRLVGRAVRSAMDGEAPQLVRAPVPTVRRSGSVAEAPAAG
ncbi:LacI family DNA-binding transcriptional regulator [Brachybacterium sp. DNPG3]